MWLALRRPRSLPLLSSSRLLRTSLLLLTNIKIVVRLRGRRALVRTLPSLRDSDSFSVLPSTPTAAAGKGRGNALSPLRGWFLVAAYRRCSASFVSRQRSEDPASFFRHIS